MRVWHCRVCGLDYDESPWGPDEQSPDHSTCECCGVEFGYEDYTPDSAREYRSKWLTAGAAWFYPKLRPSGWQLETQLGQVPQRFQ